MTSADTEISIFLLAVSRAESIESDCIVRSIDPVTPAVAMYSKFPTFA